MSVVGNVMSVSVQRLNIVTELNMYKWKQIVNPNQLLKSDYFLCFRIGRIVGGMVAGGKKKKLRVRGKKKGHEQQGKRP